MGVSKKCHKCNEVKSIAQFYKQKNGLYDRTGECKICRRKRTKIWSDANKERKSEMEKIRCKTIDRSGYNKEWREKNPEYFKQYYVQNKEIRLECNRRFWIKHPERYESYKIYSNARRLGKLMNPGQCQICGNKDRKIHAHHFDYSKPLEVTWVCVNCHKDLHKKHKFVSK